MISRRTKVIRADAGLIVTPGPTTTISADLKTAVGRTRTVRLRLA